MRLTLESPETGVIYDKEHDGFVIVGVDRPRPDADNGKRYDMAIDKVTIWDTLIALSNQIGSVIASEIKDPELQQDMVRTVTETINDAMEFEDSPIYDVLSEGFDEESKTDE